MKLDRKTSRTMQGVNALVVGYPRVLVVEDDDRLVEMLERILSGEGYVVESAPDGHRGLHLGLSHEYDVLLLDRGLPAIEGLDLLERLRGRGVTTPALMLSALGSPSDRVAGIDAGADDYLAKPFDIEELLARLRGLRRRHRDTSRSLSLAGGRLDLDSRQIVASVDADEQHGRDPIQLSERECALLSVLARHPARVFSRRDLLALVFDDAGTSNLVDTYVHYLRKKLGRQVVRTIRGGGYQLGRL